MRYFDLANEFLLQDGRLYEKQILYNHGADYGQVVFLAGGTGSGKSFAIKNFMENKKFKVLDVDSWKDVYANLQDKLEKYPILKKKYPDLANRYPEIQNLNLSNPEDVSKLHQFVKDKGIHQRFVGNVLSDKDPRRLPNLLFDVTLKNISKIYDFLPRLQDLGYDSTDIHITWTLADYEIAVKRNKSRDRIVPDDILFQTHEGSAKTMLKMIKNGTPKGVDGSVKVILNNPEHTIFYNDPPEKSKSTKPQKLPRNIYKKASDVKKDTDADSFIIDDFQYLTLKEPGEKFKNVRSIKKQLYTWIMNNAPKTADIWRLMRKSK